MRAEDEKGLPYVWIAGLDHKFGSQTTAGGGKKLSISGSGAGVRSEQCSPSFIGLFLGSQGLLWTQECDCNNKIRVPLCGFVASSVNSVRGISILICLINKSSDSTVRHKPCTFFVIKPAQVFV